MELAMVAGAVNEQNRYMVQALLAKHGGVVLHTGPLRRPPAMAGLRDDSHLQWDASLPLLGATNRQSPSASLRKDFGMFMVSEVLGAASIIFVKDEDGLYTADPKKNPPPSSSPPLTPRACWACRT
jgi:molybdenum storage protein